MNTAVWLDTAGAGLSSAHTPPLQRPLVHWRLSLHGSLSGKLWGVGVRVGVGVGVSVGVAVAVGVFVGVGVGVLVGVRVAVRVCVGVPVAVAVGVGVGVVVGVALGTRSQNPLEVALFSIHKLSPVPHVSATPPEQSESLVNRKTVALPPIQLPLQTVWQSVMVVIVPWPQQLGELPHGAPAQKQTQHVACATETQPSKGMASPRTPRSTARSAARLTIAVWPSNTGAVYHKSGEGANIAAAQRGSLVRPTARARKPLVEQHEHGLRLRCAKLLRESIDSRGEGTRQLHAHGLRSKRLALLQSGETQGVAG